MKNYFLKLFDYDQYANHLIRETISRANESGLPVQLMAHLLTAQQVWFNRVSGLPLYSGALWPDLKADAFEKLINYNNKAWTGYLNGLQPGDFEKTIHYKNLKGDSSFENKLSDILAHVINHGTHHRAQAGQHLKLAGIEDLPNTDYIFYIRAMN